MRSLLEYGTTVLDPYMRHAACVTKREYRSRETGCIGWMLLDLRAERDGRNNG